MPRNHPTPEYRAWVAALCSRLENRVNELRDDGSRGALNRATALASIMAELRGRATGTMPAAPPRPAAKRAAAQADLFL